MIAAKVLVEQWLHASAAKSRAESQ
jgi:hypothetical protein